MSKFTSSPLKLKLLQQNNTEINLAEHLEKKGVKKENIVIGLHSPFMRQFSGYAIN